jgi:hypothetical protein
MAFPREASVELGPSSRRPHSGHAHSASGFRALLGGLVALAISGCEDVGRVGIGGTCAAANECASSLCVDGLCVDPAADEDQDGIINGVEYNIGSDAGLQDSDADQILDPDELGPGLELVDTDRDGKPDIVESAIADADGDCITDQYDADDGTPNTDKSPMIAAVCPEFGICGAQWDKLRAACPDGGGAVCILDDVVGYANPEVCDGRDDNCDGRVDEDFPNGCGVPKTSFIAAGSGGKTVATQRFRATLAMGQPALKQTGTSRFSAVIGGNPALTPAPRTVTENP